MVFSFAFRNYDVHNELIQNPKIMKFIGSIMPEDSYSNILVLSSMLLYGYLYIIIQQLHDKYNSFYYPT